MNPCVEPISLSSVATRAADGKQEGSTTDSKTRSKVKSKREDKCINANVQVFFSMQHLSFFISKASHFLTKMLTLMGRGFVLPPSADLSHTSEYVNPLKKHVGSPVNAINDSRETLG